MNAILLPGFNGAANQPILVKLEKRLTPLGLTVRREALPRGRPSPGLEREVAALAGFAAQASGPVVLVGRSFGGRVCARYAAGSERSVAALVLLGFPIRPPSRPRPDDEAALLAVRCPTLIVQGDADELGPLRVLRPLMRKSSALELAVIRGAGHSYGRRERLALDAVTAWLPTILRTGG